jgi:hypothetical protein
MQQERMTAIRVPGMATPTAMAMVLELADITGGLLLSEAEGDELMVTVAVAVLAPDAVGLSKWPEGIGARPTLDAVGVADAE